jgi:hypothetical protein
MSSDGEDQLSDDEDDAAQDEEVDLAAITRLYQKQDKYGIMAWHNVDSELRVVEQFSEQESSLRNVERLLKKTGFAEAGQYLNDLNVFPKLVWGKARLEIARLWASPQIIGKQRIQPADEDETTGTSLEKATSLFGLADADQVSSLTHNLRGLHLSLNLLFADAMLELGAHVFACRYKQQKLNVFLMVVLNVCSVMTTGPMTSLKSALPTPTANRNKKRPLTKRSTSSTRRVICSAVGHLLRAFPPPDSSWLLLS